MSAVRAVALAAFLAMILAIPTAAQTATTVMTRTTPQLGTFLVDGQGKSLYLYTRDSLGTTNCYDACATAWPPLVVASGSPTGASGVTGLGTITRRDGAKQVTYNNIPLYYFARDANVGDVSGQGVGNVWFVVQPGQTTIGATTLPKTGGFPIDLSVVAGIGGGVAGLGWMIRRRRSVRQKG